ncbi:MAG: 4-hydroxy-3-methylbut-2-enyl diphosphate reductase [Coriobacteriaceae bacterium]|nr:4-hydroxy-3-methylbut-2-enyl diphosphate reductase [Coriobacteriaceae bacterium]
MGKPAIEVARMAGTCFGVQRALDTAINAADTEPAPVQTLGPLIHNPRVVADLAKLHVSMAETLDEVPGGTVIIRAHGVVPQIIRDAESHGLHVVDATCPFVKKVHRAASHLVDEGFQVLVVGESGHPEVEGIMGHAGDNACVVAGTEDLESIPLAKKVGVVVQTTQTVSKLQEVVGALVPRVSELRVVNTICSATQERQSCAAELAQRADAMVVIGGKNSGNTRRLAQICLDACPKTHHIESAAEVEPSWFDGCALVGVTAGASTPASHIQETVDAIEEVLV